MQDNLVSLSGRTTFLKEKRRKPTYTNTHLLFVLRCLFKSVAWNHLATMPSPAGRWKTHSSLSPLKVCVLQHPATSACLWKDQYFLLLLFFHVRIRSSGSSVPWLWPGTRAHRTARARRERVRRWGVQAPAPHALCRRGDGSHGRGNWAGGTPPHVADGALTQRLART